MTRPARAVLLARSILPALLVSGYALSGFSSTARADAIAPDTAGDDDDSTAGDSNGSALPPYGTNPCTSPDECREGQLCIEFVPGGPRGCVESYWFTPFCGVDIECAGVDTARCGPMRGLEQAKACATAGGACTPMPSYHCETATERDCVTDADCGRLFECNGENKCVAVMIPCRGYFGHCPVGWTCSWRDDLDTDACIPMDWNDYDDVGRDEEWPWSTDGLFDDVTGGWGGETDGGTEEETAGDWVDWGSDSGDTWADTIDVNDDWTDDWNDPVNVFPGNCQSSADCPGRQKCFARKHTECDASGCTNGIIRECGAAPIDRCNSNDECGDYMVCETFDIEARRCDVASQSCEPFSVRGCTGYDASHGGNDDDDNSGGGTYCVSDADCLSGDRCYEIDNGGCSAAFDDNGGTVDGSCSSAPVRICFEADQYGDRCADDADCAAYPGRVCGVRTVPGAKACTSSGPDAPCTSFTQRACVRLGDAGGDDDDTFAATDETEESSAGAPKGDTGVPDAEDGSGGCGTTGSGNGVAGPLLLVVLSGWAVGRRRRSRR